MLWRKILSAKDGDSMYLQNVGICLQIHVVLQPGRTMLTIVIVSVLTFKCLDVTHHDPIYLIGLGRTHIYRGEFKWKLEG
jgi:hypothetical protein